MPANIQLFADTDKKMKKNTNSFQMFWRKNDFSEENNP